MSLTHTRVSTCVVQNYFGEITDNRIWILSIKNINKDNELFYNYGYSYDTDYIEHVCKCGSFKCIGYILDEDEWPKLKKKT